MNFKRIGRALICLILVCALLVNVSPIRADALVIESMLVNAGMVALSCMLGLGVGFQTYEIAMPYIDDCVSYLQSIDYVNAAEQISIYSAGTQQYYANQALVEAVRDWLFDSKTLVVDDVSIAEGYWSCSGMEVKPYTDVTNLPYILIGKYSNISGIKMIATSSPLVVTGTYTNYYKCYSFSATTSGSLEEFSYTRSDGWILDSSNTYDAGDSVCGLAQPSEYWGTELFSNYSVGSLDANGNVDNLLNSSSPITESGTYVTLPDGLSSFEVFSRDIPMVNAYSSWVGNSISIPGQLEDDESVIGLPLGLGPNLSDMIGLTQADVWSGTSTYGSEEEVDTTEPSIGVPSGSLGATDAAGFLGSLLDALMDVFEWFWGKIETFFGPWIDRIESWFSDVVSSIQAIPNALSGYFLDIIAAISSIPSTFRDWLLGIVDAIAGIPGAFAGWFADIIGGITSIPESIADVFGGVIDGVIALPGTIADVFADVIAGVIALPQTIADAITDAISALFVPSVGYIDAKVETLTSKFPFAKTIADSSLEMKKFLLNLGQQPPIIYIDLGAATGSYMWGGKTIFVDLTWYAQYKGTMDAVISAFLWLWFVWRMTFALPGIIQGTSGFWSRPDIPKENTSLTITGDSSHYFRR